MESRYIEAKGEYNLHDDGDYKGNRNSKTINTLLVRPEVGKTKRTTYNLPKGDYTYGKAEKPDAENAKQVTGSWAAHKPSRGPSATVNLIAMNRKAASQGCTNAADVAKHRKTQEVILQKRPSPLKSNVNPHNGDGVRYGRSSVPDGDFHALISNQHQQDYVLGQRKKAAAKPKTVSRIKDPVHTRASLGHAIQKQAEPKKQFKLKQFSNVQSRSVVW